MAYLIAHDLVFDLKTFAADYGANISTSLISFTIAVLVIDWLNERRSAEERKRAIIQQMGSPVNDAALEALRIACIESWSEDGSMDWACLEQANLQSAFIGETNLYGVMLTDANLQGADLNDVNLESADMGQVNLQGACVQGTNLQRANLSFANLREATVAYCDLQGAKLTSADLKRAKLIFTNLAGADLTFANLLGADLTATSLSKAILDESTVLPNGDTWAPDADLSRFTNPRNSDFWRSDDPDSPAYGGKESQFSEAASPEKKPQKRRKKSDRHE